MDALRYVLAIVLVVLVPMVITFWVIIHSGSTLWKQRPAVIAYSFAGMVMLLIGIAAFVYRDTLIGNDLGMSWPIFISGFIIYICSLRLAAPVRRYLNFKTFAGVPEVSNTPTKLLIEGPYAAVRHPRYFMVLVGIVGWALMANYAMAYTVSMVCISGMVFVIQLEERELQQRFGVDYANYKKSVPQIIPRLGELKKFL